MFIKKIFLIVLLCINATFALNVKDYNLLFFKDNAEYTFEDINNIDINWQKTDVTLFSVNKNHPKVWFRYKIPKDYSLNNKYIGISEPYYDFQIYLDNKLIVNEENALYFNTVSLDGVKNAEYIYLKINVKDIDFPLVGAKYVLIGEKADLMRFSLSKDLPLFIISCFFLFIGFGGLIVFLKNIRNREILATSILMIAVGGTFCLMNSVPSFLPIPNNGYIIRALSVVFSIPIGIFCFMLLKNIFISKIRYMMLVFQWFFIVLYIFAIALLIFANQDINIAFGVWRQMIPLASLAMILSCLYEAVIEKNIEARIFLVGIFSLLVSTTSSVLISLNRVSISPFVIEFGYFIFLGSIVWISVRVYSSMNKEIAEKNKELMLFNANLESNIRERTEQLEQANIQLTMAFADLKEAEQALKDVLKKHHLT